MKSILHAVSNDTNLIHQLTDLFKSVNISLWHHANIKSFLDQLNDDLTGSILLDVNSAAVDALSFLDQLKRLNCLMSVIVISDFNDLQMAIAAMKLGAKDFLLKPYNDQLLLESIQKNNRIHHRAWEINQKIKGLSLREKEILKLILEGQLNRMMATQLDLSISTVEAHRRSIMKKLQVKNKAQLIRTCFEMERIMNRLDSSEPLNIF